VTTRAFARRRADRSGAGAVGGAVAIDLRAAVAAAVRAAAAGRHVGLRGFGSPRTHSGRADRVSNFAVSVPTHLQSDIHTRRIVGSTRRRPWRSSGKRRFLDWRRMGLYENDLLIGHCGTEVSRASGGGTSRGASTPTTATRPWEALSVTRSSPDDRIGNRGLVARRASCSIHAR